MTLRELARVRELISAALAQRPEATARFTPVQLARMERDGIRLPDVAVQRVLLDGLERDARAFRW